jgi:hypothetical protein
MRSDFMIALRGYDITEVDHVLTQAEEALRFGDDSRRAAARTALETASFTRRLRGYARHQVDRRVRDCLDKLA